MRYSPSFLLVLLLLPLEICHATEEVLKSRKPQTFDVAAKETLTVVRMNHGDVLRFRLRNGEMRTFVLDETSARIIERIRRGAVYSFECRLLADGQPLALRRYVGSQETFYEPWVVNGVRIWFSSSASIFEHIPIRYPEDHDSLKEDAILAVQDATLPICPQPMRPWFPIERHFIDIGQCYGGDDPWLGPYLGQACHMGMDVNMPKGTPLYAPIDFDDQWIFSADHRWRGVRRWENGDIWGLQSHHLHRLLAEEGSLLKAGAQYAEAAGKAVGETPHSHFEFHVGKGALNRGRPGGTELDPWILFWQIFETDKNTKGMIRAVIVPLAPAVTGEPVRFLASGSQAGPGGGPLRCFWTFGDGGWSDGPSPQHVFVRPGVYPVTLVVDDGRQQATHTQHITVNGEPVSSAALVLEAPDNVTFQRRPPSAADVYGWPVKHLPHTLQFTTTPNGPPTASQKILLRNAGAGVLPFASPPEVRISGNHGNWLRLRQGGEGNNQWLEVAADRRGLPEGQYEAVVFLHSPGALNAMQGFRVKLNVRPTPEADEIIVDDKEQGCFATPFFWVGHQNARVSQKGCKGRYLTNGGREDGNAIVRYTPDLSAGQYKVSFHPETPVIESSFLVRIRHASGEQTVRFAPHCSETRSLGTFEFSEGTDGFLEILARDSEGLVVVDAVVFQKTNSK